MGNIRSSADQCLPSLTIVGTSIAKTRVSQTSIAKMSSITSMSNTSIPGVGGSSIRSVSGDNSSIVGMSGSVGVMEGESMSNLANGISISISFSLSLAIVSSISRGSIGSSGDYSNIVGMSGSNGVMDGESSSDLSDSVSISIGISFGFSLTLAVVSSISVSKTGVSADSRGSNNTGVSIGSGSSNNLVGIAKVSNTSISKMPNTSISKMSNTSISNMSSIGTVANGTESADNTVRIVNTSHNTPVGESSCYLSNSVGISLSFDSGHAQKDKCKSSHLGFAEHPC